MKGTTVPPGKRRLSLPALWKGFRALWEGYRGLWDRLTGWKLLGFLLLHDTILFLLACVLAFSPALQSGRSLIWQGDSLSQHFPRYLYISETFREAFRGLLAGEGWNFPLYDFRVGLTMQDTQMGFPQILAALCPGEHMVGFYGFAILLNYYMAGLAFTVFGWYFRQRPLPILIGAVSYPFCGYALAAGVWHPYFMQPMVYLPLLLIGTEQVLRKRPAWMLPAAVFLSLTAQNGLYFSCMQGIFVVIYAFIRFFDWYGPDGTSLGTSARFRELAAMAGRLALWGGCGVLLAGFAALPALMSIVDIGRVGKDVASYQNLLHYEADYYRRFFAGFAGTPGELTDWTCLGFTGLSVPCVALLFGERRREARGLRRCFLVLTAMLWIPAAGYVLSGFSNVSNRFCYAYAFCVCAIVMFLLPRLAQLDRRGLARLTAAVVLYAALVSGAQVWQDRTDQLPGIPLVLFTLAAVLLALEWRGKEETEKPAERAGRQGEQTGKPAEGMGRPSERAGKQGEKIEKPGERTEKPAERAKKLKERTGKPAELDSVRVRTRRLYAVCLAASLLSVWTSGWLWYSPDQRNSVGSLVEDPWAQIRDGQYFSLAQSREIASDEDFFRVAGDSVDVVESNLSWYYGFNGVSMFPYYGYSAAWLDWVSELEMSRTNTGRGTLFNLDTRASMLSLASVKYFALRERNKAVVPYGFTCLGETQDGEYTDTLDLVKIQNGGHTDTILKNENWLPLGYTYDRWISRELYDALETPVKEEVQMSAAALDEAPSLPGLAEVRMVNADEYGYVPNAETAAASGRLDAAGTLDTYGRSIPWQVTATDRVEWAEDGTLDVQESGATMTLSFSGLPRVETYLRVDELDLTDGDSTSRWQLRAETEYGNADSLFIADAFVYSYGQHSQIFDLGWSEEPVTEITLHFPVEGIFYLGNLEVWQQSMEHFAEQAAALREEPLENIELNRRGLAGTITVSRDKLLCLSVPRLRGWRAYLDGRRVKVYDMNTAFLGIEVPAGTHTVEFRYTLAGWPAGLWMSVAGAALLAALIVRERKKGTEKKKGEQDT